MLNDRLLILRSTLEDIISSLKLIQQRFQNIKTADDFLKDERGLEKLDSISMRLIAIGEGFKNVDKLTDFQLLEKYPQIPWRQVKGVRDILSHHYFDLDAETIYEICANEIDGLLSVTMTILDQSKIEE
ncbi:MAG: HepT-like ribonuclease domain-containing protein [Sulfuricurvum sp.]|uniref:HepT-like ribonuclease domain-containing protein n=1 Tax=Sulfuricurvum sp. TaxID=2025608 RepID=UPI00356A358B